MGGLLSLFAAAGVRERALLLLLATVVALVLLSLVFAAYTLILRLRNQRGERRWETLSARWEGPVLDALLDPAAVPRVHEQVRPEERLYFVRFVLEFSRRVRGEEREVLRELALPYLEPIAQRSRSRSVEARTRAVQTLGTLGLPRYAGEVLTALDDPSPVVAMVAARALCREEYPHYAQAVLRRLARFEGWSTNFLASMLASIGPEAGPSLRESLADDGEATAVRSVAADALRLLGDLESADVAARIAGEAQDRELVAASLRLLSVVGRPEHVAAVRARCAAPDFFIRASAVSALGTLAEESDRFRLLGALSDPSPWVAIQAARGLLAAGGRQLLSDLVGSDHPRALLAKQVLLEDGETP